ncbi:MAG: aminopeptidase [Lachnospiraceae bacterium]|nr:aminopeptidase [Lachnospiraceae bacterium]MCI7190656.1 aminopeptidase [Lachnospiraceae bacterium]MDD7626700.1 aminopeptidase [Lachnospiraceae bacterium]MDY4117914.1 aminopeptidase [Lachnospiraceae bacterium]
MEKKNTWETYSHKQLKEAEAFAKEYMQFLDEGKTERECVDTIVNTIEKQGYQELSSVIKNKGKLKKGDKVYAVCMNKAIVMFRIGEKPMEEGMNILGAHIDSPRLDVKQNPLYEEGGFAYLDTHYYGGVKKYQWVTIPLALHGVIVKKDGTTVELSVGEDDGDPVFFISDLLIHLAQEQMEKKASKVIEGEALDLIIGNKPLLLDKKGDKKDAKDSEEKAAAKDAVKKGILAILKEKYDIEEEDFISAELEIVPAGKAREAGFDRSMILAYGQDDRVCAFSSLKAMLEVEESKRTACCLLVDKEEIGSVGATGMESRFFENMVAEVLNLLGEYSELTLRRCLSNSCMLSSDVSSAFDPSFASSFDKKNVAYLGGGMVFNKFTGSRGKSGSNDANAEYLAHLRHIFEKEEINFQTAELGKVDLGGGGTIAYILALYGMNVIDSGVAVLNMHAPWEATSKADVYETKRGYVAFLKGAEM